MNILHLAHSNHIGGASRYAVRVHQALLASEHQTTLISSSYAKGIAESFPIFIRKNWVRNFFIPKITQTLDSKILNLEKEKLKKFKSPNLFGAVSAKDINKSNFDVVNLHWINGGTISLKTVRKIEKPIVWHVLDQWPMAGAQHYMDSQSLYRMNNNYSKESRSILDSGLDFDRICWNLKIKVHPRISAYIAISSWVKQMLLKNPYVNPEKIIVINPPVDTTSFFPENKSKAKIKLGIDPDNFVIGYAGATSFRKGWDEVSELLIKPIKFKRKVSWLFFGGASKPSKTINNNQKIYYFGQIRDDDKLRNLYSAMDLLVFPSKVEALGLIAQEAMTCGTPIITYRETGTATIVKDGINGMTISSFQNNLRDSIFELTCDDEKLQIWSKNAAKYAKDNWSYSSVVQNYLKLYKSLTK